EQVDATDNGPVITNRVLWPHGYNYGHASPNETLKGPQAKPLSIPGADAQLPQGTDYAGLIAAKRGGWADEAQHLGGGDGGVEVLSDHECSQKSATMAIMLALKRDIKEPGCLWAGSPGS